MKTKGKTNYKEKLYRKGSYSTQDEFREFCETFQRMRTIQSLHDSGLSHWNLKLRVNAKNSEFNKCEA